MNVVQLLLNHGAIVDQINIIGWTALMYASQNGHSDIVSLLLHHGSNIEHRANDDHATALIIAQDDDNDNDDVE
jgi:ankyrin repeat protein